MGGNASTFYGDIDSANTAKYQHPDLGHVQVEGRTGLLGQEGEGEGTDCCCCCGCCSDFPRGKGLKSGVGRRERMKRGKGTKGRDERSRGIEIRMADAIFLSPFFSRSVQGLLSSTSSNPRSATSPPRPQPYVLALTSMALL